MIIEYPLFLKLHYEALEQRNLELYIAERGWQEWMNEYSTEDVICILETIHEIAVMSVCDMRNALGIESRAEMSRQYEISNRTLENWDYGKGERQKGEYGQKMISYTVFIHLMNERERQNDIAEED